MGEDGGFGQDRLPVQTHLAVFGWPDLVGLVEGVEVEWMKLRTSHHCGPCSPSLRTPALYAFVCSVMRAGSKIEASILSADSRDMAAVYFQ